MFVGRESELAVLAEAYASTSSELCVIYGRRRIGKSTLLEQFVQGRPAFFYLAGREGKRIQLRRFVRELGEAAADPLTSKVLASSWDEALTLLDRSIRLFCEQHGCAKAIIVLDEFQWMCRGAPELLSDLQRFWDKRWKDSGEVMLVLCGSAISFMLGEVLARKSPLFGRRTLSFDLRPFNVSEAAEFLEGKGAFEVAETYLAVGGVPKYLEILSGRQSFRSTMGKEALSATGFLFDEVRFVLGEQLRETEHYFMVLANLGRRAMGVAEIESATGIPSGQLMHYLERLQLLGFVSRHIPFEAAVSSKKVRYRLDDYYLRFYFTFIHPNRERIRRAARGLSWQAIAGERWDAYAGQSFEHFVQDHAEQVAAKLDTEVLSVGSHWQRPTKRKPGVQIDVLIGCEDETTLLCECKWSKSKTGMDAVHQLRRKVALFPNKSRRTVRCVVIAAGGVTEPVRRERDIFVLELGDFWQTAR